MTASASRPESSASTTSPCPGRNASYPKHSLSALRASSPLSMSPSSLAILHAPPFARARTDAPRAVPAPHGHTSLAVLVHRADARARPLFPRPPSYRIARGTGAGWAGAAAVARVGMGTRRAEWPGRGARGTQTKAGNERGAPQGAGREDGRRDASRAATRLRDGREGGNPAPRMVEWTQPTRAAPDGGPARTGRRRASPRGPRERDLAKGRA